MSNVVAYKLCSQILQLLATACGGISDSGGIHLNELCKKVGMSPRRREKILDLLSAARRHYSTVNILNSRELLLQVYRIVKFFKLCLKVTCKGIKKCLEFPIGILYPLALPRIRHLYTVSLGWFT